MLIEKRVIPNSESLPYLLPPFLLCERGRNTVFARQKNIGAVRGLVHDAYSERGNKVWEGGRKLRGKSFHIGLYISPPPPQC